MVIVRQAPPDLTTEQVIKNLRELITALDRRVPRLERTGEAGIARNAAALRREALERIAELERQARDGRPGLQSTAPRPPTRAGIW